MLHAVNPRRRRSMFALMLMTALTVTGCASMGARSGKPALVPVVEFADRQVTGVAASDDGRVFINFPYWSQRYRGAVAEVMPDGSVADYPDAAWNRWRRDHGLPVETHFVCVQAVLADGGKLYVLDTGAPMMQGPLPGAAKLVVIDLSTNRVQRVYPFGDALAPAGAYLNDLRIDPHRPVAYLTDSGRGALVVLDLETGQGVRVLEDHPSTRAEPIGPRVAMRPLLLKDTMQPPAIHADGIALSPDGAWVYYHALTGFRLYRVPTAVLVAALRDEQRAAGVFAAVEDLGPDAVTDGMLMDAQGRLYLTALEDDAILRRDPDGTMHVVVTDERLAWPDTLAVTPDGDLLITVSRIHEGPQFVIPPGSRVTSGPFGLYRLENAWIPRPVR